MGSYRLTITAMTPKQTALLFANDARHTEALAKHGHQIGGLKSRQGVLTELITTVNTNLNKSLVDLQFENSLNVVDSSMNRDLIDAILLFIFAFSAILIIGSLVR